MAVDIAVAAVMFAPSPNWTRVTAPLFAYPSASAYLYLWPPAEFEIPDMCFQEVHKNCAGLSTTVKHMQNMHL